MPKFDVTIPDPSQQHLKNPKWKTVDKTILDEKGNPITVKVKKMIVKELDAKSNPVYEMGAEPTWGLGCPAGCGRLWEFTADASDIVDTVDADGVARKWPRGKTTAHFKPLDPAAYSGVDEKGNPTEGYLSFRPDPSTPNNIKMFNCDRCGAEVRLVKQ